MGLQSLLLEIADQGAAESLQVALREEQYWEGIELLADLAHPEQESPVAVGVQPAQ